jgi:hypothetical protein
MAKKKPNYLSAAEIQYEENYNMVGDGIINNVPKPSVLERLDELEKRKKERHKEEIVDGRRERHKADHIGSDDDR